MPALRSRQSPSSLRLNAATSWNDGTGTKRFPLWHPTLFPAVKSVSEFDPSDLRFQEGYGWEQLLGVFDSFYF